MNINNTISFLFDFSTYLVLFDRAANKTGFKGPLFDRDNSAQQFIELTTDSSGSLSISMTSRLPGTYDPTRKVEFDFDSGTSSIPTAFCFFSTDTSPSIVIGVGDIRNLTAKYHRFKLGSGVVLSSTGDDALEVYYLNSSDYSNNETV
jgi:hypothetical protein